MFDFQSYVQKQRADTSRRTPKIQNYAYILDIDLQRQISALSLANRAMSLGIQAWQLLEGRKLKSQAHDITRDNEHISRPWADTCFTFSHTALPLRLIPSQQSLVEPYGDDNGTFFGISPAACTLPPTTLKFLFGRAIGALDNGHVPYLTLSRSLNELTHGILEHASQIPEALLHWMRSADITQDRAGILAARDISAAIFALMKNHTSFSEDEIMREIRNYHEKLPVDWGKSNIEKRIRAIEIFMTSDLYIASGRPIGEIDDEVTKLFSIFNTL